MKFEETHLFDMKKITKEGIKNKLTDRFLIPPFSILDTKQGYWQSRKRLWQQLGIQSELGRGDNLLELSDACSKFGYDKDKNGNSKSKFGKVYGDTNIANFDHYREMEKLKKFGKCLPDSIGEDYGRKIQATSIFDPVLCELIYRWFAPTNGKILDMFAGGSVRGIVAEFLDYHYTGIELRKEQVEANNEQIKTMDIKPVWIHGNSMNIDRLVNDKFDLLFTCPPYYNLEVYSDLDGELSALPTYAEFLEVYGIIINKSCQLLKNNRFACIVIGDIRNDEGFYLGLVKDTINLFEKIGFRLYNEAILVNVVGSLPVRVANCFKVNRKLGKMHQNVLIFYKGNPDRIKDDFPELKNLIDS